MVQVGAVGPRGICIISQTKTLISPLKNERRPTTSTRLFCSTAAIEYNSVTRRAVYLRGGADKSLARPTSRYRRTESIVSLERGVCSCAELQVFSCYRGWKEACQATCAISTTSRRELSSSIFFFPARQGAEGNSRHSDRNIRGTCTVVCHRQKLGGLV